jgi:hypothetical protein
MSHHHQQSGHEHQHKPKQGVHRDWRLWVGVLVMLGAMFAYVFSEDEALQPAEPLGEQVPAAAE